MHGTESNQFGDLMDFACKYFLSNQINDSEQTNLTIQILINVLIRIQTDFSEPNQQCKSHLR